MDPSDRAPAFFILTPDFCPSLFRPYPVFSTLDYFRDHFQVCSALLHSVKTFSQTADPELKHLYLLENKGRCILQGFGVRFEGKVLDI